MSYYSLKQRQIPLDDSWDIIVVGGGPAGCAAAAAAAREGARVLLVEAAGALGGMSTLGLVPTVYGLHDCEKIIARGLAGHIVNALREHTPDLGKAMEANPLYAPWIDPELLKRIYDDLVTGAEVLFQTRLCAVDKSGDDEVDVLIAGNKSGLCAYSARVYIDCTGDGDLAAWAGASFEKGDQTGQLQPATHCFMLANVDEHALNKGPKIHFFDPQSPIYKAVQSEKYPLIVELHSCSARIGPGVVGFNTGHVFNVDNTDPAGLSQALILGRRMAAQYRDAFAEFHPAFAGSFLAATGGLMGIRESRRITGDYILTADDFFAGRSFADEICRNAFGIDIHSSREKEIELAQKPFNRIRQEILCRTRGLGKGESVGVPFRCLTPKGLKNLLVAGRCISTDRQVNGSIRVMACCLNTGEAAGIAAAMACVKNCDVHTIDTADLRIRLKKHGAYLPELS